MLRHSLRPARFVNYPTGLDHAWKFPRWGWDKEIDACNNRIEGEEFDLNQLVDNNEADVRLALYYDGYSDVPMTRSNQTEGKVDRTVIIREFLLDSGLPESNLSRDLSELQNYLVAGLGWRWISCSWCDKVDVSTVDA